MGVLAVASYASPRLTADPTFTLFSPDGSEHQTAYNMLYEIKYLKQSGETNAEQVLNAIHPKTYTYVGTVSESRVAKLSSRQQLKQKQNANIESSNWKQNRKSILKSPLRVTTGSLAGT